MKSKKQIIPTLYPLNRDLSKVWFVEYVGEDGRHKKKYGKMASFNTLEGRLSEADKVIASIKAESPQQKVEGNQVVHDLWEIFELRSEGWKPKSASAYRTHLKAFTDWYSKNHSPVMDSLVALKFLKSILDKNCNTTRNNYRSNLKSLFSDLKKFYKHRYPENPFEEIRKLRESRKTKEWFRPMQVMQLMKLISQQDKQLWLGVKFLYYLFDRPAEMRMCRIADINFETKKLRIESKISKVSKIRFVPIPDSLINDLQYLKKYPEHYFVFTQSGRPGMKHIGRDTLSKRHQKILNNLRYPKGYVFYSWKNTGAVKMLMNDQKNIRYISKCMGHSSLDMTDKYFQSLGVDDMAEKIIYPELI